MNEIINNFQRQQNKTKFEEKKRLIEEEKKIKEEQSMKDKIFEDCSYEIFLNNYKIISKNILEIEFKNSDNSLFSQKQRDCVRDFAITQLGLSSNITLIYTEIPVINNDYYWKVAIFNPDDLTFFEKLKSNFFINSLLRIFIFIF